MSTLIAITYDTAEKATEALEKLGELQKIQLVTLEDAAVAVKDPKGKVKVTQTLEKMNTGSAAIFGGFWGLLIGLLCLAPIFWGLFGALMGALFSKGTDLGIDNKFINCIRNVSQLMTSEPCLTTVCAGLRSAGNPDRVTA